MPCDYFVAVRRRHVRRPFDRTIQQGSHIFDSKPYAGHLQHGGGHRNAGTCQLDNATVDSQLPEIIKALNA